MVFFRQRQRALSPRNQQPSREQHGHGTATAADSGFSSSPSPVIIKVQSTQRSRGSRLDEDFGFPRETSRGTRSRSMTIAHYNHDDDASVQSALSILLPTDKRKIRRNRKLRQQGRKQTERSKVNRGKNRTMSTSDSRNLSSSSSSEMSLEHDDGDDDDDLDDETAAVSTNKKEPENAGGEQVDTMKRTPSRFLRRTRSALRGTSTEEAVGRARPSSTRKPSHDKHEVVTKMKEETKSQNTKKLARKSSLSNAAIVNNDSNKVTECTVSTSSRKENPVEEEQCIVPHTAEQDFDQHIPTPEEDVEQHVKTTEQDVHNEKTVAKRVEVKDENNLNEGRGAKSVSEEGEHVLLEVHRRPSFESNASTITYSILDFQNPNNIDNPGMRAAEYYRRCQEALLQQQKEEQLKQEQQREEQRQQEEAAKRVVKEKRRTRKNRRNHRNDYQQEENEEEEESDARSMKEEEEEDRYEDDESYESSEGAYSLESNSNSSSTSSFSEEDDLRFDFSDNEKGKRSRRKKEHNGSERRRRREKKRSGLKVKSKKDYDVDLDDHSLVSSVYKAASTVTHDTTSIITTMAEYIDSAMFGKCLSLTHAEAANAAEDTVWGRYAHAKHSLRVQNPQDQLMLSQLQHPAKRLHPTVIKNRSRSRTRSGSVTGRVSSGISNSSGKRIATSSAHKL